MAVAALLVGLVVSGTADSTEPLSASESFLLRLFLLGAPAAGVTLAGFCLSTALRAAEGGRTGIWPSMLLSRFAWRGCVAVVAAAWGGAGATNPGEE